MSLTPEQLAARRHHVGASDVAAIVGHYTGKRIDPFTTAAKVWASKVLGVDAPAGEAADMGHRLESVILDHAEITLSHRLSRNVFVVSPNGVNAATLDGAFVPKPYTLSPVEAKTCGIVGPSPERELFGEDGTDQIPPRMLLQVQAQLYVTQSELAHLFALIGGRGFAHFRVHRNERLIRTIVECSNRFWQEHVLTKTPPEGEPPPLDMLKAVERTPGLVADVPDDVLADALAARQAVRLAEARSEEADARLLQHMGVAMHAKASTGTASLKRRTRRAYSVAATEYVELTIKEPDDAQ